jgi:primosomal protein N' (replication factor Y)
LHFPNVTLVGIIHADMALHLPDFRAGERTFQLLVQVAGRAGRGDVEGEVVVQTFTPHKEPIQFARQHDYLSFYDYEIEQRRETKMPPLTRMICLTVRSRSEEKAKFVAEALEKELQKRTTSLNVLMGKPTPAPLAKVQNQYRYQVILRSQQILTLVEAVNKVMSAIKMPDGVNTAVDVDPIALL